MRKYPIGLQDFRGIREDEYLYIDKTRLIYDLIGSGKYFFLSRPRRFGKSLLMSTIKEIFSGSRELFKGLWIENHWNWEKKYPVIHISLSRLPYETGLSEALTDEMDALAAKSGFTLRAKSLKGKFDELIQRTAVQGKVVILIDEYDKPIVDYLDDLPRAEENKAIFKSFYSVLKDADNYIQFLLITGVSRFSKVSIFSDLNNLEDISLVDSVNEIVGITQSELEENFDEELDALARKFGLGKQELLERVKFSYNGYSWRGKNTLYNPFSVLHLVKHRAFDNFWFQTGTTTFLLKAIRKEGLFILNHIQANVKELGNLDLSKPVSIGLLFQTGYLTIKKFDWGSGMCELGYPNKEVEDSLNGGLLNTYISAFGIEASGITNGMGNALKDDNIPMMIAGLNSLISSIPYDHWKPDTESIFHIIMHLAFTTLGMDVRSEAHSSHGRADIIIQTATHIYAIELKLDGSADQALDQVLSRNYLHSYQSDPRQKVAIGISFSSEKRAVDLYKKKILLPPHRSAA